MNKQKNRTRITSSLTMLIALIATTPCGIAAESALSELLKVLHEDGTLSEVKYKAIVKLVEAEKLAESNTSKEVNDSSVVLEGKQKLEPATLAKVTTKGKLEITSPDEDFTMRIGGRVMIDGAVYDDDISAIGSAAEVRRARLFTQGTLWKVWGYKLQYDFTGTGELGIRDAYIQYTGLPIGRIKLGHFKEPFSLQNMTSSKYGTFMERGLTQALSTGRSLGIAYGVGGSHWTANTGLYGQGIGANTDENDQSFAVTSRVTFAPYYVQGEQAFHIGAAYSYRKLHDGEGLRFRERPGSHVTNIRLIDTGSFDAERLQRMNVEALWIQGPLSLQAEYSRTVIDRSVPENMDVNFNGYYIEGSWFLTGESLSYNPRKGSVGKVVPNKILGQGGFGAWQIATRFSNLDLTDEDVLGGEEDNFSVGVNWYPNPNLRFMANYVKVLDVKGGSHDGDEPSAFTLRAQVEF